MHRPMDLAPRCTAHPSGPESPAKRQLFVGTKSAECTVPTAAHQRESERQLAEWGLTKELIKALRMFRAWARIAREIEP